MMRHAVFAIMLVLATMPGMEAHAWQPPAAGSAVSVDREQMQAAVAAVKPSLVRIKVVEPQYWDGREAKSISFGSGTIVTPEGHVVTNHHVAGKAVRLMCTLPNREVVPAVLIGTDAATDIAVIKLMPEEPREWPFVEFGDSDAVRVGDPVLALGSPLALSQSVTLGIISNTEMVMPESFGGAGMELDGENVGELVRWFAHDAAIYGGNSGGPLVNMAGEIIGVNEISLGLAGAIPGNLSRHVANDIIKYGYVRRAWAGVTLQPLLDSLDREDGVLIGSVITDSPASVAGIEPGDILLSINGAPVSGRFEEDLPGINNMLADLPLDEEAALVVMRAGEEMEVALKPVQRQPSELASEEFRDWGMTARNLTVWTKLEMARETTKGVLITSVSSGGPVSQAKPAINARDVIVRVNDRATETLEDLRGATAAALEGANSPVEVLVTFEREDEQLLTVVKVGILELDDPGRDVRKAWLPIETQVFTKDVAKALGMEGRKGVRVSRLYPDRPEDFPLQVGDIITALDGEPVDASEPHDSQVFDTMVRQYRIGTESEFSIIRGGEAMVVAATMTESPAKAREMRRYRDLDFEFVAREAAFDDRQKRRLQGVEFSVVVDAVTRGGWANLAGLEVGDALLTVNGHEVASLDQLEELMDVVRLERVPNVVLFVRRGTRSVFVEIQPDWDDASPLAAGDN